MSNTNRKAIVGLFSTLILVLASCNSSSKREHEMRRIADSVKQAMIDSIKKAEPKVVVDTTPKKVVIVEKEANYRYMQIEKCADYWISIADRKVFLTKEEALNYYGEQGWRYVDTQMTEKGEKVTLEQKLLK